jgi:small-conductance mechanosensitive channel
MEFILESLRADWQSFLTFSPRLVYAIVMLLIFWFAGSAVGKVTGHVLRSREKAHATMGFVQRLVTWVLRFAGVMLALGVMGFQGIAASILATGGVLAIVLGFAFKEIGENLLAGVFLVFSRPFEMGDLIKTGGLTGTVKALDIRSLHIRTADACDVYVPNAQIFRQELYNYTRDGLRRPDFTVGIAYHDEPEQVVALLERTVRGIPDVLPDPRAFVMIQSFADSYVEYQVFFYLDTNESKRNIVELKNDVMTSCWRALREAGMTFSTDITTALDVKSVPAFKIEGLDKGA